ncbi:hypothetical protein FOZ60_015593 [Perkinsus olseni]|uniref:Uncharacterized protein n=1 Tax=Perkinsus olseni TaxID=32597 RepID=A0A7J6N551_PEROL|nr:hypothetical protein FOZ60_015593 [Perkinsus olseni]
MMSFRALILIGALLHLPTACIALAWGGESTMPVKLYCNFKRESVRSFMRRMRSMCALVKEGKVKKILVEDGSTTKAFEAEEESPLKYTCKGKEFTTDEEKLAGSRVTLTFKNQRIFLWDMNRQQDGWDTEDFRSNKGDLDVPDYIRVEDGRVVLWNAAQLTSGSSHTEYRAAGFSGYIVFDRKNDGAVFFDEKNGRYAILRPTALPRLCAFGIVESGS